MFKLLNKNKFALYAFSNAQNAQKDKMDSVNNALRIIICKMEAVNKNALISILKIMQMLLIQFVLIVLKDVASVLPHKMIHAKTVQMVIL